MEAVRRLLDLRYRSRPEDLPPALAEVAPLLDAVSVTVLLVDYEQLSLWPLHGTPGALEPRMVDGTLAGVSFCTAEATSEATCLWLPLLHGAERLGVLEVCLHA